jgi:hypothetical protein
MNTLPTTDSLQNQQKQQKQQQAMVLFDRPDAPPPLTTEERQMIPASWRCARPCCTIAADCSKSAGISRELFIERLPSAEPVTAADDDEPV